MSIYTGYLAIHNFESELERELELKGLKIAKKCDRLYLVEGDHPQMIWAQITAFELETIAIASINDGAKKLKALGRNWGLFTVAHHRRAQLIQEELPKFNTKPIPFRHPLPTSPMGFWTLLEPDQMIASTKTTSSFALGDFCMKPKFQWP